MKNRSQIHVYGRPTTVGRYEHVVSMSRFRLAPKIGHLERLKMLYGYLSKTKHFAFRYRTKDPNYSHLPEQKHDWSRTVHGNCSKTPVLSLLDLLLSGDPQLFLLSWYLFLKIACLHVSFTAYENFYKTI